jgi:hypothetical protein
MKTCNPSCVTEIPNNDWSKNCDLTNRKGGIPYLTFVKCDPEYEHPNVVLEGDSPWSNLDNVKAAICAGILYITAELIGQKPKGSFTKRRLTSCSPEQTVSGVKTITFQDFNADEENLLDYDFWDGIDVSKRFMAVGWITCGELWYQTDSDWDLELDEVIEDTSEGFSFKDGTITINEKALIKPFRVPGILNLIQSFIIANECY